MFRGIFSGAVNIPETEKRSSHIEGKTCFRLSLKWNWNVQIFLFALRRYFFIQYDNRTRVRVCKLANLVSKRIRSSISKPSDKKPTVFLRGYCQGLSRSRIYLNRGKEKKQKKKKKIEIEKRKGLLRYPLPRDSRFVPA